MYSQGKQGWICQRVRKTFLGALLGIAKLWSILLQVRNLFIGRPPPCWQDPSLVQSKWWRRDRRSYILVGFCGGPGELPPHGRSLDLICCLHWFESSAWPVTLNKTVNVTSRDNSCFKHSLCWGSLWPPVVWGLQLCTLLSWFGGSSTAISLSFETWWESLLAKNIASNININVHMTRGHKRK